MADTQAEKRFRRTGQIAGLTIAVAGLAAVCAPWIVGALGLAPRFEMLIYLCTLAAMAWAMFVAWGMWQTRRAENKD